MEILKTISRVLFSEQLPLAPKAALGAPAGSVLSEAKAAGARAQMVVSRRKKRTIGA